MIKYNCSYTNQPQAIITDILLTLLLARYNTSMQQIFSNHCKQCLHVQAACRIKGQLFHRNVVTDIKTILNLIKKQNT